MAIADFVTIYLMKSQSTEDILEATEALIYHQQLKHLIAKHSIPFVNSNGNIIYPPFSLPIIAANTKHLTLFASNDCQQFHVLHPWYSSNEALIQDVTLLFDLKSLPPLPQKFSWMNLSANSWGSKPLELLSLLGAMISKAPLRRLPGIPPGIKNFLDSQSWLPTTGGFLVPRMAYMCTPELLELFRDTVPFVVKEIYDNVEQRAALAYTTIQKIATSNAVTDQILYYKAAQHHNINSILPLLQFLLERAHFPKDQIIPFCINNNWEWLRLDDCVWIQDTVPMISISPKKNLAFSELNLSSIKPLLIHKLQTEYSLQECMIAWKKLASMVDPTSDDVEPVMALVYHKLTDIDMENLDMFFKCHLWCGTFHKFQPCESVLYCPTNTHKDLVAAFEPNQLKLLWLPSGSNFSPVALKIRSLSSAMIDRVKYTHCTVQPLSPLFSPLVRKAMCCWHAKQYPSEWQNRVPEQIQKLVRTNVEEISVSAMEVIKCAHVNGEDIPSSLKELRKVFLDLRSNPPVLYRSIHETELVIREFSSILGKTLAVKGEPLVSFCYFVEGAIIAQKYLDKSIELRIDLETNYPKLTICSERTSNAYVEPVTPQERASLTSPSTLNAHTTSTSTISLTSPVGLLQPQEETYKQQAVIMKQLQDVAGALEKGELDFGGTFDLLQDLMKSMSILQAKTAAEQLAASNSELDQPQYEDERLEEQSEKKSVQTSDQGVGTPPGRGQAALPGARSPPFSPYSPQSAAVSGHQEQRLIRRNGNRAGRMRTVIDRPNQADVREKALARFNGRCIVTGVDIPEILEAAHIIPWSHGGQDVDNDENCGYPQAV